MDLHSTLMLNGLQVLEDLAAVGSPGTHEHPADPGRAPYPSIFSTREYQQFEVRALYDQVTFPQCALGAPSEKPTTLGFYHAFPARQAFGELECTHEKHELALIGRDETGAFRTRRG